MNILMQSIGVVGAFLVLLAFLMNEWNKWKNDSLKYDVVNLGGSLLLLAYALAGKSYPFAVLNLVWLIFSIKDVIKDLNGRK